MMITSSWAGLAITAAVLTSFLPIINKRLLATADVSVVPWAINLLSLPLLVLATAAAGPLPAVDDWFYLGVVSSAILNLVATLVSTQALKVSDASVVAPFLTFNPLFSVLVAAFILGEIPSRWAVAGIVIVALGAYVFDLPPIRQGILGPVRALAATPGVLLATLASFIWGLTPVAEKVAIEHSHPASSTLVALTTTAGMVALLTVGIARRPAASGRQIASRWRGFVIAGLIAGIAPIFGFAAIGAGPVGDVTALFKLSLVLTMAWAGLFLGEKEWRDRLPGAILMVVGSLLIAL